MTVISKLLSSTATLVLLLSHAVRSPVNHQSKSGVDVRQAGSFYGITGVKLGGVQPRLEIRQLQQNTELWNLYLLALEQFKNVDQNDKLSYYQIAGIHGVPLIPWDDVQGSGNSGYCPHGSNLFGPWHRPYVALFEQALSAIAADVVSQLPDGSTKDAYTAALPNFRAPYWDWALTPPDGDPILPASVTSETAQVTYPNGTTATIPNPLYSYTFHPFDPSVFANLSPFNTWPTTIRGAQSSSPDATSDNAAVEQTFEQEFNGYQNQLYSLFVQYQGYTQFSNEGSGGTIGNLESIHDLIHSSFGNGHMSVVPVAAFDPVFWLHHANVDRLLALWQGVYPETYLLPVQQRVATYTIQAGSTQDANSPLEPFHTDSTGDFWTSNLARNVTDFGYTYPELQNSPSNATLKASINAIYAPPTASIATRKRDDSLAHVPREYMVQVETPFNIPGGHYSVRVSLGGSYVGAHINLDRPNVNSNTPVTSNILLSRVLSQKYQENELRNLDEESVVAYLKGNLKWHVERNGAEIPRNQVQGLKVTVVSTEVKPARSASEFPEYVGAWKTYDDITG